MSSDIALRTLSFSTSVSPYLAQFSLSSLCLPIAANSMSALPYGPTTPGPAASAPNPATSAPGTVVTTTIQSTYIVVPTVASSPKINNIAPIVGGVIGGIVTVASPLIIILIYWRRRRRRKEPGGNLDNGRVVRRSDLPNIASAVATPFEYEPPASSLSGPTSPTFSDGSMRQYRDSQVLLGGSGLEGAGEAIGTSGSHYAYTSSDGPSAPLGPSSQAGSHSHGSAGLGPGFPVGQPLQPFRPQYAKQPEASRRKGMGGLASASEQGEGNVESHVESPVIQHEDGGRVAESEPVPPSAPQEIPPSYDSIPGNVL